ncbi:MAG TPA: nucleoside hydrolase [Verrucomicrobiota bacterium]|nr:nucleoside hydrolase [Verrucomicrobiota bacterium]HQL77495.1 nucleoside hydrolase [Verrucomicrobiota bacterium]
MTSTQHDGRNLPGGNVLGRTRRLIALGVLLSGLLARIAGAHDGPSVIVDTDMASDDARALALLLNCPYLNVLAIVTSDGVSPPDVGATNVCRMLGFLKQDNVAVGIGRTLGTPPPPFRTNATGLDWTELGEPRIPPSGLHDAARVIQLMAKAAPTSIVYICLGPLSNLADALEGAPDMAGRIGTLLWFGTPPKASPTGWNELRDEAAYKKIAAAGLQVEAVYWPDESVAPVLDDALLDELAALDSPAAELIVRLHSTGRGAELARARHLRLWDDLVALRFLDPGLGALSPVADQPGWSQWTPGNAAAVRRAFCALLRAFPPRATVIMDKFPTEAEHLLPDVRKPAAQIIARHGLEEWKAAVLTSELHRHLGTYSIVGAKMGLRARERFNVALDELRVESHAGLKPPLSCVNDGLQTATGASLGRGTISVPTNVLPACQAIFSYGERRLRLRLKPEFARRIAEDMATLEKKHGGLTPAYFQEVRAVSFEHWLNFDRNTMFDEAEETTRAQP